MPDKIVNHFVLADGSIAKYDATQLAGDIPEVVDIRTGYDGTVYPSAGDAVRDQIEDLVNVTGIYHQICPIEQVGVYYPPTYVDTQTLGTSTSWAITEKAYVHGYKTLTYSGISRVGVNPRSVWFDANNAPISAFNQKTGENTIEIPANAYYVSFSIYTEDTLELTKISSGSMYDAIGELESTATAYDSGTAQDMAWSWWVTNTVVDEKGVLYFGYISDDGYIGVGMRFPAGRVITKKLSKTRDKDDHNAPAVNLLSNGHVLVTGSDGHGKTFKRFVFLSSQPYTIDCEFNDYSYTIQTAQTSTGGTTYAQTFIDTDGNIYCFFRYHNNTGNTQKTAWCVAKSTNNGVSWEHYVACYTSLYCKFSESNTSNVLNVVIMNNPRTTNNAMYSGYIDLQNGKFYKDDGTLVNDFTSVPSDGDISQLGLPIESGYTKLMNDTMGVTGKRRRLLDVAKTNAGAHIVLYAEATSTAQDNFVYYKWENNNSIDFGESGLPMYMYSSYLGGACFGYDENNIIYCRNNSNISDGTHTIHYVVLNNGNVVKDDVIFASGMTISRPTIYDGNRWMAMIGHYYDTSTLSDYGDTFTNWKFDAMFN